MTTTWVSDQSLHGLQRLVRDSDTHMRIYLLIADQDPFQVFRS